MKTVRLACHASVLTPLAPCDAGPRHPEPGKAPEPRPRAAPPIRPEFKQKLSCQKLASTQAHSAARATARIARGLPATTSLATARAPRPSTHHHQAAAGCVDAAAATCRKHDRSLDEKAAPIRRGLRPPRPGYLEQRSAAAPSETVRRVALSVGARRPKPGTNAHASVYVPHFMQENQQRIPGQAL